MSRSISQMCQHKLLQQQQQQQQQQAAGLRGISGECNAVCLHSVLVPLWHLAVYGHSNFEAMVPGAQSCHSCSGNIDIIP